MYVKRIQLVNYGPIDHLDINLPFEGDTPRPILLVGENGSGKSILLSHIANGILSAKAVAYPDTPEVEPGKVYKLRSNAYIKSGNEYYFGRVDFEDGFFLAEIRAHKRRQEYATIPTGHSELDIHNAWNKMKPEENDHFDSNISINSRDKIEDIFFRRCILYFPHNRFEEPAWLNEENLKAQARHMDLKHIQGQTERKVINYSPLRDNQNWLFDLLYDRAVLELHTQNMAFPLRNSENSIPLPVFFGYSGDAARTYETVLQVVQTITRRQDARFGIGRRRNRVVSLTSDLTGQIVPNIFQLSSGETSLLNLFLSVLRDFDLCDTPFSQSTDIRGIVVVDEVDLHLHAVHQHEVLPELIKMFPNVQFVVTTHSPFFVLGMQRVFGENGFALYRLPQGHRIDPEEFSEFGDAYQSFTMTRTFANDIQKAIEENQQPILLPEGETDIAYLKRASQVLARQHILNAFQMKDGGGAGKLTNIYKDFHPPLTDFLQNPVVLLFDCDKKKPNTQKGKVYQ